MPADHPRTTLSPREAARLTRAGRSSIMRAIAAGHLPARRDNRNQWQIEREALDRWNTARADHDRTMTVDRSGPDRSTWADHPKTALALAAARATIAQLEARLEDRAALVRAAEDRAQTAEDRTRAAEAERDRWRALAERLTEREAPQASSSPPSQAAPRPRRWWPWSRG